MIVEFYKRKLCLRLQNSICDEYQIAMCWWCVPWCEDGYNGHSNVITMRMEVIQHRHGPIFILEVERKLMFRPNASFKHSELGYN